MRWPVAVGVLALGLLAVGVYGLTGAPAVRQPIQFPHKTHLDLGLQCTSCHDQAETSRVAGRPATAFCLSCHAGGDVEGEQKKLQAFAESGEEIPWVRVWRLPSHVFFSHRVHVTVAQVTCQTCHGPMETLVRPPTGPLKPLGMTECIRCHETGYPPAGQEAGAPPRRASVDCNTCHR